MRVYIITEGSSNIGFGHITRMLSIYQAFEEKSIKPKFIINGDESILDLIKDTDYEVYNWLENEEKLLSEIKDADIAIVDSYLADRSLYEKISNIVKVPVYYDDDNRIEYPYGIVVNGNIHARELDYPEKDCIEYLLGLEYLPLRKEFWDVPEKDIRNKVETIMITFGGDDIRNMTPKVLKVLTEHFPNLKKKVIVGKGFKNIKEIEGLADKNTELIYFPNAKKMKQVMLDADIAISAGGQTLYELARVGVPTIAIIVAKNQENNVKSLKKEKFLGGSIFWQDKHLSKKILSLIIKSEEKNTRQEVSQIGKKLVNGKGSKRIVNNLLQRIIKYREVKSGDIWGIYNLSNQESVRQNSLSPKKISKSEHKNWFDNVEKNYFSVAELNGNIIGQCRIDKRNDKYFISISIDEKFRSIGIGKTLLKKILKKFFAENKNTNVFAIIKDTNYKSIKLFESFNFIKSGKYKDRFLIFKLSGEKYHENSQL